MALIPEDKVKDMLLNAPKKKGLIAHDTSHLDVSLDEV